MDNKEIPEEVVDRVTTELFTHTTECEHEWFHADSDDKSDLVSLACAKCWSGISVNNNDVKKYLRG